MWINTIRSISARGLGPPDTPIPAKRTVTSITISKRAEKMSKALESLTKTGTKLYLDSVEPGEIDKNLAWGAVGATSNPAIISAIVSAGGFDDKIESLLGEGHEL